MLEEIQSSASAVMSCTGQEVARLLLQTPEQRTVAVTFPNDKRGRAAERVIRQAMELLPQLIRERQQETLKKLIDAFLADVNPRKRLAKRSTRACRPRQRR
jgi:hypothetical protein